MNATTVTQDMTLCALDEIEPSAAKQVWAQAPSRTALVGKLYQFHGFRVLDADDQPVGIVDWIWPDEASGQGDVIGVQLRWLRGTARAVPADGVQIDRQSATIRVAYRKDQIKRSPRFTIDRALTADQKRSIRSHYSPPPAVAPSPAMAEGMAA
jgi:hypothetical protein